MTYDVVVIGGGLAGLTGAIRCAAVGLKTVVVSAGESALAFASGSIDVLGIDQKNGLVQSPFAAMTQLPAEHPYQKVGVSSVKESLTFFVEQMAQAGIKLNGHDRENHGRLTALGAIRPAWLSQEGTKTLPLVTQVSDFRRVAIINIAGFRDFQPALLAAGMKKQPGFSGAEFILADIKGETLNINARNAYELRSLELARTLKRDLFSQPNGINILSSALQKAARDADLVVIPSVLAVEGGNELIRQLEVLTGLSICEVATLPPSLPGMRMASALKQRFRQLGGLLLEGDEVLSGHFEAHRLCSVTTRLNPDMPISASHFILATGSFFSQGLASDRHHLTESVFALDVEQPKTREQWSDGRFIDGNPHNFSRFGVTTSEQLNPYRSGQPISNLYCAGAVLNGVNPVQEASSGGVAISTGWFAANRIIAAQTTIQQCADSGQNQSLVEEIC